MLTNRDREAGMFTGEDKLGMLRKRVVGLEPEYLTVKAVMVVC